MDPAEIKDEHVKQETNQDDCLLSEEPISLSQYLPLCSSNASQVQSVCRICHRTIMETKVSLLSVHNSIMLIEMLRSFTSVQVCGVYPENDLPYNVCETCRGDIIHCYEFKIKCDKSETFWQSLLQDQVIVKEDLTNVDGEKSQHNSIVKNEKEEIKGEILLEDIEEEYLEDINDLSNSNEALCIVQNNDNRDNCSDYKTDTNSLLLEVFSQNSLGKQFTCNFCFKRFDKVKKLRAHIAKRHSTGEYTHPCDCCKEVFSSQHDLQVHSAVHTTGPLWSCNKCNKSFKVKAQLKRHIQRHMESKRFSCDACGKAFTELYALRRHARVHTGEAREKKFACHLCDKRYSENNQLSAHLLWHAGERRCVCATCGKAFASTRLLASHRLVHSDDKPYKCTYCEKRFRHESTRSTHHRTHTGEKPYVCAVCGKTFIQNSNLTLHMRTHTGEKPYSCDKCDRQFSTGSSLKNHQRRHTGEKPYECSVCGKRFARRDLSAHMRQHSGERPHACSVCPKKFVSAARLRDHCRIHTGEKPFECATCTKTFSTKSHLVKHLKKHQSKKKRDKRQLLVLTQADNTPQLLDNKCLADGRSLKEETQDQDNNVTIEKNNMTLELTPEVPVEVTSELVVEDNGDVKEILVMDNSQNDGNYQCGNICINTDGVNYVNSDVNLVTVNEGTTVKLYQLDQSLVQIHSSGGQVTISKITSKMTANF